MFKNILLTVDLNQPATWRKALPLAVEMASAPGAKLHILSVVPGPGTPLVDSFFPKDFEEKALAKARSELEKLVAENVPDNVEVNQHLAFGTIHQKVLDLLEKIGCDLIVMASHAPDRVREFLVGSHADRVVRRSSVSVLVVRE